MAGRLADVTPAPDRRALPWEGRWVALEPLRHEHVDPLHRLISDRSLGGLWPRTDLDLTRPNFEQGLWHLARLNYVVVRRGTAEIIGLVQGINDDVENRTVGLSVVLDPNVWNGGWPIEAVVLMVHLLFEVNGFRKIYWQMAESTRSRVGASLDRWLTHEATFTRHRRRGDDYEDWHIFALHRRDWDPRLVTLVTGGRVRSGS